MNATLTGFRVLIASDSSCKPVPLLLKARNKCCMLLWRSSLLWRRLQGSQHDKVHIVISTDDVDCWKYSLPTHHTWFRRSCQSQCNICNPASIDWNCTGKSSAFIVAFKATCLGFASCRGTIPTPHPHTPNDDKSRTGIGLILSKMHISRRIETCQDKQFPVGWVSEQEWLEGVPAMPGRQQSRHLWSKIESMSRQANFQWLSE